MIRSLVSLRALVNDAEQRVWNLLVQMPSSPVRTLVAEARSHLRAALNEIDGQIEVLEEGSAETET